jgi:hypothetical protein
MLILHKLSILFTVLLVLLLTKLLKLNVILSSDFFLSFPSLQRQFNGQMADLTVVYLALVNQSFRRWLLFSFLFSWSGFALGVSPLFGTSLVVLCDSLYLDGFISMLYLSLKGNCDLVLVVLRHQELDHAKGASDIQALKGDFEVCTNQLIEGLFINLEVVQRGIIVSELIK